jgi:hypothetical protein
MVNQPSAEHQLARKQTSYRENRRNITPRE